MLMESVVEDAFEDKESRCALCGTLESEQDWDFVEYKDAHGVTYVCLMCTETY